MADDAKPETWMQGCFRCGAVRNSGQKGAIIHSGVLVRPMSRFGKLEEAAPGACLDCGGRMVLMKAPAGVDVEEKHGVGVLRLLKTRRHDDARGWFMESWNKRGFEGEGVSADWVQDNVSRSAKGVIRGMHYQLDGQAKLVRCVFGCVVDVVADLRPGPDFGTWSSFRLSASNTDVLYVPGGFAHGFMATEESVVLYKVDRYWDPGVERGVRFDDPELGIPWRKLELCMYGAEFVVSAKDRCLPLLRDADVGFVSGV